MRTGLSEALMGIGGIFVSFGATILVISVFARRGAETRGQLPAMMTWGTGSLVVGAVLFAAGYFLARMARGRTSYSDSRRGAA
jgi:uncharacterized membrane protein (UPF0136 family)